MELPEVHPLEESAVDTVVSVLNRAKEKLGVRQTLRELVEERQNFGAVPKLNLKSLGSPLAVSAEAFIRDAIEKKWKLTDIFMFVLNYKDCSSDETSNYYYYEAVFSQPTVAYPIPQATATAYFRVQDKYVEPPRDRPIPTMIFRVEGQHAEHDVRYVSLDPDWLLAVIRIKANLCHRIEQLYLF